MSFMINYLKSTKVVIIPKSKPHGFHNISPWIPLSKRHAQIHQRLHPIRPKQTQVPRNNRTPIMSHNKHLLLAWRHHVQQRHQVPYNVNYVKLGGVVGRGSCCIAIPAEIGCHCPISAGSEEQDLVAPGVPQLWEAVKEKD